MVVDSDLLTMYKRSIGDLGGTETEIDSHYITFLEMAISDLQEDDISEERLSDRLGRMLICLYAEALMNKTDIATNPTIELLRNKLSLLSKGDR